MDTGWWLAFSIRTGLAPIGLHCHCVIRMISMSFWTFPSAEIAHKHLCPEGWCCNSKGCILLYGAKLTCPTLLFKVRLDEHIQWKVFLPMAGRLELDLLRCLPAQTILWFYINFWPVWSFHSCLSPVCGSSTDSWRDSLFVQEPNSWQSCCVLGEYTLWETEQPVISSLQQSTPMGCLGR